MNDDDLRERFDVLVDRVPPNADALPLVRTRAARLRRRRASAAVAVLTLVVVAVVAVPETLQHQAKSHPSVAASPTPTTSAAVSATPSASPVLTDTCTPALTKAGREYGDIQHFYGLRSSGRMAAAWVPQGGAFLAVPAEQPVALCLIVGNLDRLAASSPPDSAEQHMHYAVLADSGGGAVLVEASPDPLTSPLPGVDPASIEAFQPVPQATLSTMPAGVANCAPTDLVGALVGVGFPDGVVQGTVVVHNSSHTACRVHGAFHLALLDATGAEMAQNAQAVMPVVTLDGVLQPASPGVAAATFSVGIYGLPAGGNVCRQAQVVTPRTFLLKVGDVVVRVRNHTAATAGGATAVSGCPGTITADRAEMD